MILLNKELHVKNNSTKVTLMNKVIIALALTVITSTATARDISELSSPIVLLTPAIAQNQDALQLNASQRAELRKWMSHMPAQRGAQEDKALEARAALRTAIINNEPQETLEALAAEVGSMEKQLLLMRAHCANHWREVLNEEQFAQALKLAGH